MFKPTGLLLCALAMGVILPGRVLWADHVPSKRSRDAAAAAKVESRLLELGATAEAASRQVGSLTSEELAFFAADRSRIQVVAGLSGEEWLMGGAYLGGILLVLAAILSSAKGI